MPKNKGYSSDAHMKKSGHMMKPMMPKSSMNSMMSSMGYKSNSRRSGKSK